MGATPVASRRTIWTWVVASAAALFWVVGIGCGWRGVLLLEGQTGIVGKAQAFGDAAAVWWVPASVLTLTVAAMGIGIAIVRHLVDWTEVAGRSSDRPRVETQLELLPGPVAEPADEQVEEPEVQTDDEPEDETDDAGSSSSSTTPTVAAD